MTPSSTVATMNGRASVEPGAHLLDGPLARLERGDAVGDPSL
jgi:hypothetical protein